jgi:hypothetical protein
MTRLSKQDKAKNLQRLKALEQQIKDNLITRKEADLIIRDIMSR